ncbi:MAG: hypothetical protein ACAI38_21630 [Myxococcota bacterium]
MSVRFQARIVADTASEYLAAATRGAPVAQTKHASTATLVGQAADAAMGAAAVALYDIDAARITMGVAYLARGGLAALGAFFTGFRISFGNGSGSGDSEVNSFNRKRRTVTAAVNLAIGTALLTGIAGREAAMAGTVKGAAEAAFGPLVESLTRPTLASVPELVQIVRTPANTRQQRVAESDLRLVGVYALPELCEAYSRGTDAKVQGRFLDVIEDIVRWPAAADHARIATTLAAHAATLVTGGKDDVQRGVRLLNALHDDVIAKIPQEHIASLVQAEKQLAAAATGTEVGSEARRIRDLAGAAIARVQGNRYASLDDLMRSWDGKPEALSARVAAISAFGIEAIEPLRQNLAKLESYYAIVAVGAEVSKRLETLPIAEALAAIPDDIDADGHRGKQLLAMRTSGSVDRKELDVCASQAPEIGAMRDAYRALLDELEGRAPVAPADKVSQPSV